MPLSEYIRNVESHMEKYFSIYLKCYFQLVFKRKFFEFKEAVRIYATFGFSG